MAKCVKCKSAPIPAEQADSCYKCLYQQQAEQIGKLREKLDEISNTYPIRCTGLKNGSLCAYQIIQEIVNEAAPPQKDEWTKSQRL